MTETLKSIRLIHRLLIVVAATMIVSSLSARNWQRYAAASEELTALLDLPLDSIGSQIGDVIREEVLGDRPFAVPIDSLLPLRGTSRLGGYLVVHADSLERNPVINTGETFAIPPPPAHPSVSQLYNYLAEFRVRALTPSREEFRDRASLYLGDECRPCVLISVMLARSKKYGSFPVWDAHVRFRRAQGPPDSLNFTVFGADTVALRVIFPPGRSWVWHRVELAAESGTAWAAEPYLRPILAEGVASKEGLFPRLQLVWSEVKDLGLSEALAVMGQRVTEERNSFSLLGLTMSDNVAVTIATPILLAFLWYLYVMMAHVERLLVDPNKSDERARELREFPLVLYFKGTAPELLSGGSVMLLPAGSLALVFFRAEAGSFPPWWRLVLYTVAVAAVFVTGGQCLSSSERVVERVQAKDGPSPDAEHGAGNAPADVSTET